MSRRSTHGLALRLMATGVVAFLGASALSVAMAAPAPPTAPVDRSAAQRQAPDDVVIDMSITGGFSPQNVEIKTGTTVVWRNLESTDYPVIGGNHQVVALDGSFASPQIPPGSSWTHRFLKPGDFPYHDANYRHMTGTLTVTGPPITREDLVKEVDVDIVERDPNDQDTWGYKPADITIETGTTVIWRNIGAQPHTATADNGEFDSGEMASGDKWDYKFTKPGVFYYNCEPHPWMKAVVRVAEPGKAPPTDPGPPDDGGGAPPPAPPPASGGGSGPQTHTVNMIEPGETSQWGFDPQSLAVQVGDTVTWQNTGGTAHTATADDGTFDSGMVDPGGSFDYTFDKVGEFTYKCEPHPWMTGVILVSKDPPKPGAAGSIKPGAITSPGASPMASPSAGATEELGEDELEAAGAHSEGSSERFWLLFGAVYLVAGGGAWAIALMRGFMRGAHA